MDDIADGTVGVRQAVSPDRLIDNEVLTVGAQTVYRQRVQDPESIALLQAVKAAVEGTITAAITGDVSLSAATLAALETVNAVVSGAVSATVTGTVALDAPTLAALESVTAVVSGTVALDAPTLAALESITATIAGTVTVDGTVELGATTLAALESINATVTGTVELGATTLAALETIGLDAATLAALETISIANFPSDYPDAAVLAKVEAVRALLAGTLTVGGTVAVSNFPASVEVSNDSGNPLPITDNAPEFWRIKNKRFTSSEEVRYDIPASLISASIYTGVAADGTATSSAVWTVIRTYFDSLGNPSRERIRTNVAWDSRTAGWT